MKKFEFRLEPVLKYRRYLERLAQQETARAHMNLKNCENKIMGLKAEYEAQGNKMENAVLDGVSASEFRAFCQYLWAVESGLEEDYQRVFELFPRLAERSKQRSESLSGGEQQMLAVGRALMSGCTFLMLDEPSMGLAPLLMYDMFRALKKLNEEGMTILLIEQNAHVALQLADRGYLLDTGDIVVSGTAAELMETPEIHKAYLGG
jgi:ABC-type branched-subunit amino acid transport system ATPase component